MPKIMVTLKRFLDVIKNLFGIKEISKNDSFLERLKIYIYIYLCKPLFIYLIN